MRRMMTQAVATALVLTASAASSAWAQANGTPTRAGTEIKNTATASFTDANGNTYNDVTAEVTLVVAFVAGPTVDGPTAAPTPTSPSTGNRLTYTLINMGNDFDGFQLTVTPGPGITVTGYEFNGTVYPDLASLNTELAKVENRVDYVGNADGNPTSLEVVVIYDVAPNQGNTTITVEAGSTRDGGSVGIEGTDIYPVATYAVVVDWVDSLQARLPSADPATQIYEAHFTVEVPATASGGTFDLAVVASHPELTIVSVNGTTGSNGTVAVASGSTETVVVRYTIASNAAAGLEAVLTLTATLQVDPVINSSASTIVRVIRPAITFTKAAHLDDGSGNAPAAAQISSEVEPGAVIWYRLTVTNANADAAPAVDVKVEDVLPDALEFLAVVAEVGNWTFSTDQSGAVTTVTATLNGQLAVGGSASFLIKVRVR